MDDDSRPEHSTGQDDAPLTPEEERQLVAMIRDPHLFRALLDDLDQALAEDLPPGPIIWMLKWWGAWHCVYPAKSIPPAPPLEELEAWTRRWPSAGWSGCTSTSPTERATRSACAERWHAGAAM